MSDYPHANVRERGSVEGHRENANAINYLLGKIESLEQTIIELVPSGYGAATEDVPVPNFDIGAGWVTLPFDTLTTANVRGMTFDLGNNTMTIDVGGAWRFSFGFALQGHNSSNGGRLTNLRLFNVTTGTPGSSYPIGIGRNVEDTSANIGWLQDVISAGDTFRLEIGGGDTVTGGTLVSTTQSLNFVDRLGSL